MVSGSEAAASQRLRWETGRRQLVRSRVRPLLRAAWRPGGAVCLDLALDLLVLPLSQLGASVVLLLAAAGLTLAWDPAAQGWLWLAAGCVAGLVAYVLRGWQLSGVGARGLLDLLRAPSFVLWKLLLVLRARDSAEWVRTKRELP